MAYAGRGTIPRFAPLSSSRLMPGRPLDWRLNLSHLPWTFAPLDMRILSGIKPTGALHIGNYFGMMRPAIALQDEGEAFYFIADYHALTSLHDPAALRENTRARRARFPRLRPRPGESRALPPVRRARSDRAGLDPDTATPMGLLETAHCLQRQGRARTSPRFGRAVRLPGADGGRHPDLRLRRRAGRPGPEAARRDHARLAHRR